MKKNVMLEWNFNPKDKWDVYKKTGFDWHQTIITKFNQLHAHHRPFNEYPIKIVSPIKFEELFKLIEYYNQETKLLRDIYQIEFINSDNDYLLFDNKSKILIKNFE